ncbi:MAG TPA: beta-ketoacyl synthase N-terminal-like domain-containing protein [Amycolatopsis sp.]|nr:beta-ketoacyl synthase N-terminal-like domain-containing protein [Amycolatopsis sp.]
MVSPRCEIFGVGAVTGYGWGRQALWAGLCSGKPAARRISGFGPGDRAVWVSCVPDGGDPGDGPTIYARVMRAVAREAITDARNRGWRPGRRVGLLHAIVLGDVRHWRDFYLIRHGAMSNRDYLYLMPSTPMSLLMQEYGFRGPAMNVSAMCASGNAALVTAKAWLDDSVVDDVIVVATDLSATPESVRQFEQLGVAITDADPLDACRPFQEGSRGFVFGEGAAGFVMSGTNRRGAPYLSLLGGAMTHDAHHVTSLDTELVAIRACFRDALCDAGVAAPAVRYLHAHGPGTKQCDRAEATVLDEIFPADTGLYSIKPLVAHCQGAAAAVEVACTALACERGLIPAPPAVAPGHPQLLSGLTKAEPGLTVKSSLGMGGHNSVVVLAPGG